MGQHQNAHGEKDHAGDRHCVERDRASSRCRSEVPAKSRIIGRLERSIIAALVPCHAITKSTRGGHEREAALGGRGVVVEVVGPPAQLGRTVSDQAARVRIPDRQAGPGSAARGSPGNGSHGSLRVTWLTRPVAIGPRGSRRAAARRGPFRWPA